MSKFADDTKLCHRASNPDDIKELQEDINKHIDRANKFQMSFNAYKCSVMHIGHSNMQSNYNMSNQQLPTTDQQPDLHRNHHHQIAQVNLKNKEIKAAKNKEMIFPLYKSLYSQPTSRTCSAILVPTFK